MPSSEAPRLSRKALFGDLGYHPHAWQWEVHRSRAPRRIVACGVRSGKTKAAAMEGIAAALDPRPNSIGWVVAPTYDLADRVYREMQVTVLEKLQHRVIEMRESDRRLILRNMAGGISEIRAKSADNPVSLLGEGLDWCIIDEAARLRPLIWESHLTQRLLDKKGWAMLISTPRGKGYFFDLYRRGQGADPDFKSWNLPSWSNPFLDKTIIEAERARLPARVFGQEYAAEFVEGSGSVFRNVRECATGEFAEPTAKERTAYFYGGLDLAKVEDYTVLTIVDSDAKVRFIDQFNKLDWAIQLSRIVATADRFNKAHVACDTTGVGDPIYERLRGEGTNVTPYPFTQKSKNALIENLAMMLEQKKVVLPRYEIFPTLIDELEAYEYSLSDRGGVRSGAPYGMHDDCVISLALASWQVRPSRPQPGIIVLSRSPSGFFFGR